MAGNPLLVTSMASAPLGLHGIVGALRGEDSCVSRLCSLKSTEIFLALSHQEGVG